MHSVHFFKRSSPLIVSTFSPLVISAHLTIFCETLHTETLNHIASTPISEVHLSISVNYLTPTYDLARRGGAGRGALAVRDIGTNSAVNVSFT